MKIAYLSSSTLISDSANSVHVVKMCQAFAELGHEVTLHGLRGGGTEDEIFTYYGVESVFRVIRHDEHVDPLVRWLWVLRLRIPGLRVGGLPSMLFGRRIVDRYICMARPDLIYARNIWWLAGLTAPACCIVDSHRLPRNSLERAVEARIYRRPGFMKLVVTSKKLKASYIEIYPWLEPRIQVARNAANDPFPSHHFTKPVAGLDVGYVGHLYEGRGAEVIVALAGMMPDVTFHVVGGREEHRHEVVQSNSFPNVIFYGHQAPHALARFYALFDIVVAPYQQRIAVSGNRYGRADEMSPLKIFEYMSWGKAILCSDLPLLREILTDGENAVLLSPSDVSAWANAIRRLLHDERERKRLAANARRDFLNRYSWEGRARDVLA